MPHRNLWRNQRVSLFRNSPLFSATARSRNGGTIWGSTSAAAFWPHFVISPCPDDRLFVKTWRLLEAPGAVFSFILLSRFLKERCEFSLQSVWCAFCQKRGQFLIN